MASLILGFQKLKKNKVIDSRKMVVYTESIITGDSLWWDFNKFLFFYSEDYAETPKLGKKKEGKEES